MARLKHNNSLERANEFVTVTGSGEKQLYRGVLDRDTGMIELVDNGVKNLYAEIQSYKDMCDINKIVARYMEGEIDILNQVQGVYGDFSASPMDLADALQQAYEAEQQFNRLPVEIKQKFDNNWHIWLNSFGSEDWLRNMGVSEDNNVGAGNDGSSSGSDSPSDEK